MNKKSKNRSAKRFLRKVKRPFARLGLKKIKDERTKEMKAKPPKVKKFFERINYLSLSRQINYCTLKVRTSVDELRGRFTETGRIQVLVTVPVPGVGEKIVFYRFFRRVPGVEEKLIPLVEALVFELSNRPSDSKGRLMNLEEVSPRRTVWRSPQFKRNKEEKEMFLALPTRLSAFIKQEQRKWNYYQNVVRKRKGVKRFESQIRKKWDIENPENAVPVL